MATNFNLFEHETRLAKQQEAEAAARRAEEERLAAIARNLNTAINAYSGDKGLGARVTVSGSEVTCTCDDKTIVITVIDDDAYSISRRGGTTGSAAQEAAEGAVLSADEMQTAVLNFLKS